MTSFDFVTATCGNCHPGGGPLEFDRDGKRYDAWMRDPASGLAAGGDNGLDGDYYKARWSETGVIEADCLLCHMPEYDLKKRNAELANLNFRWAATAGAGFGTVSGKVAANEQPTVAYDKSKFDADGNVLVHIAPEPRNETCLSCHAKPDWKKRGAAYSARTDVHMVAGLRCVDCHAAGSRAADPRIRGREVHQFGKGDDPSGWVRNDLDNTVRSCESCHLEGWRNAPRADPRVAAAAAHGEDRLPDLPHPDPRREERARPGERRLQPRAPHHAAAEAHLDLLRPGDGVLEPLRRARAVHGQGRAYERHPPDAHPLQGQDLSGQPGPQRVGRFRGAGQAGAEPALHEGLLPDVDPAPGRPEEQVPGAGEDHRRQQGRGHRGEPPRGDRRAARGDESATSRPPGFPLEKRRLVWVSDSRAYYSSTESRELPREEHEATAYASVYKFSHDVSPARAALGSGGCTDCHRTGSPFFQGAVLADAFSENDARPRWVPNHEILGISSFWVKLGAFREERLKPALYGLCGLLALFASLLGLRQLAVAQGALTARVATAVAWCLASSPASSAGSSRRRLRACWSSWSCAD